MQTKLLLPLLVATTFATAGLAVAAPQQVSLAGSAAPANASVDQVIVITAATRHVNVTAGSTVRFVVGDQSFTWNFQTGTAHVVPFDLQVIAPQGLLNHPVKAYVADGAPYVNP
ncbi:MAG: CzcE family metal-binding protein [Telluria sp.]